MKRSRPVGKITTNFPRSIHRQLEMYALAATAAGVGMLALAKPAEAKIVYTPTHKHIGPHQSFALDLNHDGTVDFTLRNVATCGDNRCQYTLFQQPATGNSAVDYIFSSQLLLASALNRGTRIGPQAAFHKQTADLVAVVYSGTLQSTHVLGPWPNVKDRYLGLKFQIHGKTHYGWARLKVEVSRTTINGTLTGYAYETIPKKPIIAGKTTGPDVITVAPGSLGHLAAGYFPIRQGARIGGNK